MPGEACGRWGAMRGDMPPPLELLYTLLYMPREGEQPPPSSTW